MLPIRNITPADTRRRPASIRHRTTQAGQTREEVIQEAIELCLEVRGEEGMQLMVETAEIEVAS